MDLTPDPFPQAKAELLEEGAAAGGEPGWPTGASGQGARPARAEREGAGGDDAEYSG